VTLHKRYAIVETNVDPKTDPQRHFVTKDGCRRIEDAFLPYLIRGFCGKHTYARVRLETVDEMVRVLVEAFNDPANYRLLTWDFPTEPSAEAEA
jgi:hypothetical protein